LTGATLAPAAEVLGIQPRRAGRREWMGLAAIALPCLVYAMDVTVLHLAVPTLTAALKPSPAQLLWIVDIYGFLLAGSLVTMGTLGDRIGRRRLLMIGAASFAAASVLAACSTTPEMLIGARAILGVAGATLAPSTLSLIRNMFHDPAQRTAAIGIWGTSFAAGGTVGPVVGGLLLSHFGWGSVFLVSVPVMGLLLLVAPRLLPEFRNPVADRLDLLSAALSVTAVLSIIYGLKRAAQNGLGATPLVSVAAGLILGAAFVRRQHHLEHPFIDLRLFRAPVFSATIAALTLNVFAIFGLMFFNAQYFQLVLGLSPMRAGLWTLPSSVCIVISSMSSPRLLRLAPRTTVLIGGLLACALGFLIVALVRHAGLPALVAGAVVWGAGAGPVGTLATDLILGAAPPERAGSAASLSETSAEFGGALGLAVMGSIGIAMYRLAMSRADLSGVPAGAAEAARRTLAGAVAASRDLTPHARTVLLEASRGAFAHAFVSVAVVGIGLMLLAAAVLAAAVARARRTGGAPPDRAG
jgi:MFS transporter, DHA2 family, multidrug resistance protein